MSAIFFEGTQECDKHSQSQTVNTGGYVKTETTDKEAIPYFEKSSENNSII